MSIEASELVARLLAAQNPDGGWSYGFGDKPRGSRPAISWTEPTALAVLALCAQESAGTALERFRAWFLKTQHPDGGWPPQPGMPTSTSVTGFAVLALTATDPNGLALRRGALWTADHVIADAPPIEQALFRVLRLTPARTPGGSSWYPGTAAWVAPTVTSILALSAAAETTPAQDPERESFHTLARRGQQFLLSRRCIDAGWNHGGSFVRSENAESYPEMTGMALLALPSEPTSDLDRSVTLAETAVSRARSAEALSWLQLGLARHGREVNEPTPELPCRTVRDVALRLLALAGPAPTNKLFATI